MAIKILLHTFRMIFGNIGNALRASAGPYLILVVVAYLSLPSLAEMIGIGGRTYASILIVVVAVLLMWAFVAGWVAVTWHRYILLEVEPGILPTIKGLPIWSYSWRVIKLFLLAVLCVLPPLLILSFLLPTGHGDGVFVDTSMPIVADNSILENVISVCFSVFFSFLMLRWGSSLVGCALNKPLTFRESWNATASLSGVILGVSAGLVLLNVVLSQIEILIYGFSSVAGNAVEIVIVWLTIMLGISILTTIYGHVIEDRPLIS